MCPPAFSTVILLNYLRFAERCQLFSVVPHRAGLPPVQAFKNYFERVVLLLNWVLHYRDIHYIMSIVGSVKLRGNGLCTTSL